MNPSLVDLSDPRLVALHAPTTLPWHHTLLELVVYACVALTIRHAVTTWRAGHREPAFRWLTVLIYGLMMELISFNFIQNYAHATFSVQLYHGQLPLYITAIYLVFHHTGIEVARRFGLPTWREAALAGLAIVLMDVPFDLVGPDAGWWAWADNTHTAPHPRLVEAVATRWYGTPVTSLYWYLLYGALLAAFTRLVHDRLKDRPALLLAVAPVVAGAVVVSGSLAMELVFWLPRNLGVPDGVIVGTYLLAVTLWASTRTPRRPGAGWLKLVPAAMYAVHAVVLTTLLLQGSADRPIQRVAWVLLASLVLGRLVLGSSTAPTPPRRDGSAMG